MNQDLLVKMPGRRTVQLFVVNLTNSVTIRCDSRLDLTNINCASE